MTTAGRLAGLVAGCWLALGAAPALAKVFDIDGLRLGMTRLEVEQRLPGIAIREVPYRDERIGFDYKITYGRVAVLSYEGEILRLADDGTAEQFRVSFTGRDELYDLALARLDPSRRCAGHFADVVATWGRPLIDESPSYGLWRTTVVLGPRLTFQCLDDARGLYELRLDQQLLQDAFIEDLAERLAPAVIEAIQFLLGQ